jgi:hypothetical protein
MKININGINRQTKKFVKENSSKTTLTKFQKYFKYIFLGSFPVLYTYYILKASGLFKNLKLDKRYKEKIKQKEEEFNIDQAKNDRLIADFEKKYDINYSIIEYEKRIKYGNKELNVKEEKINTANIENLPKIDSVITNELPNIEKNLDPTKLGVNVMFDKRLNK